MRNTNEKNLSAEQVEKKARTRFQSPNGNQEWQKNPSQTPPNRKSRSNSCIENFRFQKSLRLLKKREFLSLKKESRRFYGSCVSIDYAFSAAEAPKLGIAVSKKFGNACERNYFKRCVREAFRTHRSRLPHQIIMQVCPIHGTREPSLVHIVDDMMKLVEKINHHTKQTNAFQ